jgi:HAD superfamily hydrolase (TIGR01509 family)
LIKGIIFDLDGLMVNSETLSFEAWQHCVAVHGARLATEQYHVLVGLGHDDSVRFVSQQTGVSPDVVDTGFWDNLLALIGERGEPMDGLVPLLEELAVRGYPLGVASNSPIAYVRRVTDIIAVTEYFRCMVGADEVVHPKPAPDAYLQAARCLGVPPETCLAFEDSVTGARAALAAGMRCALVPTTDLESPNPDGIYAVYPSLSACLDALDELLAPAPSPDGDRHA